MIINIRFIEMIATPCPRTIAVCLLVGAASARVAGHGAGGEPVCTWSADDYNGDDVGADRSSATAVECCMLCLQTAGCKCFAFGWEESHQSNACYLKADRGTVRSHPNRSSGCPIDPDDGAKCLCSAPAPAPPGPAPPGPAPPTPGPRKHSGHTGMSGGSAFLLVGGLLVSAWFAAGAAVQKARGKQGRDLVVAHHLCT